MALSTGVVQLSSEDRQVLERWVRSPSLRAGVRDSGKDRPAF